MRFFSFFAAAVVIVALIAFLIPDEEPPLQTLAMDQFHFAEGDEHLLPTLKRAVQLVGLQGECHEVVSAGLDRYTIGYSSDGFWLPENPRITKIDIAESVIFVGCNGRGKTYYYRMPFAAAESSALFCDDPLLYRSRSDAVRRIYYDRKFYDYFCLPRPADSKSTVLYRGHTLYTTSAMANINSSFYDRNPILISMPLSLVLIARHVE